MRWENLKRGAERTQGLLPGLGEPVVRTFDAPEALGIRFHEVQARSAINAVPERSRMPFRWTINPFRGCTHACVLPGLLLRPPNAQVPGPERRRGLRARDRRQGERARTS